MLPPEVQNYFSDDDMAVGTWRNIVLVVVHREVKADGLDASVQANQDLLRTFHKVGALTITSLGMRLPESHIRRKAAEAMAASEITCAGTVISGEGFWASAASSVLTAIQMVRPDDKPRRTFGSLRDAVQWMQVRMDETAEWNSELTRVAEASTDTQGAVQPQSA